MSKLTKNARAFCRTGLPLAALAADPDVGGTPDDADDEIFEPFAEFLAGVIQGDAERIADAAETIIELRTGGGRDNARANSDRFGRKVTVLLTDGRPGGRDYEPTPGVLLPD